MSPKVPRQQELRKTLHTQLATIALHRQALYHPEETEALHDLRVALRTLRTILPLLKNTPQITALRKEWHDVAQATGPARDLEVLEALAATFADATPAILNQLEQKRRIARKQANAKLAQPQVTRLIAQSQTDIDRALKRTKRAQLQKNIRHRTEQLLALIRDHAELLRFTADGTEWHILRLYIKRLRYLLELGRDWLPPQATSILPILRQAQTDLGNLHDLDTLASLTPLNTNSTRQNILGQARNSVAALRTFLQTMEAKSTICS